MLMVLKGIHPIEGEICNEFTLNERDTAIHVGRQWHLHGWRPRLMVKSFDGRFTWLTSLLSSQSPMKKAA
jgi:hypothetical protein